jgi:hypothetical protein
VSRPKKETPEDVDRLLELERRCVEHARTLQAGARPGSGFALFLFDFGEEGSTAYVSNGEREDVIRLVREWLEHVERRRT